MIKVGNKMIGKCNCGAVSFEVSGKLPALYHCYCTLCQKQAGTASNAATIVTSENFKWVSGELSIKKWTKDTGFSSHFCKSCGSPVPNIFKTKYVWIPIGLMGETHSRSVANLWLSSKPSWVTSSVLGRNYDGMPEDISEFIEYLNSNK